MAKVRKAVFPVAGLGTRFLPATKAMPKEMLTVVDKPVIQYAVEEALKAGITELIFITGRGKSAIENHFDKPYELADTLSKKGKTAELEAVTTIIPKDCRLYYTRQGEPLGLGHAVACAKTLVGNEPFAVILPDDIVWSADTTPLADMCKTFEETGKSVVMTMQVAPERTKNYGILDIGQNKLENGRVGVQGFVEKPGPEKAPSNLAIAGRYVFTPAIMDILLSTKPGYGGEIQLTDAMHQLAQKEGFTGWLHTGERFDCGDKVGFQMANLFFALRDPYIAPRLNPYIQTLLANQAAA